MSHAHEDQHWHQHAIVLVKEIVRVLSDQVTEAYQNKSTNYEPQFVSGSPEGSRL